jgi:hypothetical protein
LPRKLRRIACAKYAPSRKGAIPRSIVRISIFPNPRKDPYIVAGRYIVS